MAKKNTQTNRHELRQNTKHCSFVMRSTLYSFTSFTTTDFLSFRFLLLYSNSDKKNLSFHLHISLPDISFPTTPTAFLSESFSKHSLYGLVYYIWIAYTACTRCKNSFFLFNNNKKTSTHTMLLCSVRESNERKKIKKINSTTHRNSNKSHLNYVRQLRTEQLIHSPKREKTLKYADDDDEKKKTTFTVCNSVQLLPKQFRTHH